MEDFNENKLAIWCDEQRELYKQGKLEQWKIDELNSIDFPWEKEKLSEDDIYGLRSIGCPLKSEDDILVGGNEDGDGKITLGELKALDEEMYQEYLAGNLDPEPDFDGMSDDQLYNENRDEWIERMKTRSDMSQVK